MLVYQVKCNKCGKVFDKLAKSKDRHRIHCECGGSADVVDSRPKYTLERQIMSTHSMKCKKCGKQFEEVAWGRDVHRIKCECGGNTEKCPSTSSIGPGFVMFGRENKPLVLEHMTDIDEPNVEVTSKQQLIEACKKHNCISHTLD